MPFFKGKKVCWGCDLERLYASFQLEFGRKRNRSRLGFRKSGKYIKEAAPLRPAFALFFVFIYLHHSIQLKGLPETDSSGGATHNGGPAVVRRRFGVFGPGGETRNVTFQRETKNRHKVSFLSSFAFQLHICQQKPISRWAFALLCAKSSESAL